MLSFFTEELARFRLLLLTLPRGIVEPPLLHFQCDTVGTSLGTLLSHFGAHVCDIHARNLPRLLSFGRPFRFNLVFLPQWNMHHSELQVALASIARHSTANITIVRGTEVEQLHVTFEPESSGQGSVSVTVFVPKDAADSACNAEVVIDSVTFAGQPITSCEGQEKVPGMPPSMPLSMPLRIRVVTGIHAPLVLAEKGTYLIDRPITPVITSDGTLYVPHPDWCYDDEYVRVFAADGSPLPSLGAWSPRAVIYAAAFDEATGTLLFPHNSRKSPLECELVAVDAVTHMVRWSQFLGSGLCQDIAVLPAQDRHLSLHQGPNLGAIAVTSDYDNSRLCAHRLFDGSSIARVNAKEPTFLAADSASATVYASTHASPHTQVTAFLWNGTELLFDDIIDVATEVHALPLAVVPPNFRLGIRTSFLVVGGRNTPTLHVFSLPDRRLVHVHELEQMKVRGLAADPSGTALAICDGATKAIHVLTWPLQGMLPRNQKCNQK